MARYRPVAEQFRIATAATLEETRKIAIAVAKREHERVMATEPRPTSFKRYVDGVAGAPEEALDVRGGVIVYDYSRMDEVVAFALATLREKSPLGPPEFGHYRDAHQIFVNDVLVTSVEDWQPDDTLYIANPMPYARKIEAGSMTMTVPGTDHVYAQADQIVAARFEGAVRTGFTYREINGVRAPALTLRMA